MSGMGKEQGKLPLRHEIPDQYKWKLELIYADDRLWEEDFRTTRGLLPQIAEYRGTLALSPKVLLQTLTLRDEIETLLEKLYVYAKMRKDEDNTREKYQELADRAQGLAAEAGGAL